MTRINKHDEPDRRGGFHHGLRRSSSLVRTTFNASAQIDLQVIATTVAEAGDAFDSKATTVVIIDLDTGRQDEMHALERLMAHTGAGRPSSWWRGASMPTWRGGCCRCGWPTSW